MFTPDDLDLYPDGIDGLFQALDDYIIKDYARRVAKAGKVTETAEWISEQAELIGLSEEEIQKETARILNMSQKEIEEVFEDAAFTAARSDVERFTSVGLSAERIAKNTFLANYIKAATKQTNGELKNITRTLGTSTANGTENLTDYYRRTLDFVQLQVSNGITDYNTAVRNAVKDLSAKGIQYIDYESGRKMNVASAARMCTLTGINQMARHMNDGICDELGLDLVETTAHMGARPTHQEWQGRWFSRSGKHKVYPPLVESTGLGTAEGLCGVNCRHTYYGVHEDSPRAWSDEELKNIDPPSFEYDGKTYTYYEASQRMRYMERQMRKTKRESVGYEAAGLEDDFTASSIKLNRQKEEYNRFSKASGIRARADRTQELGYNRSVSGKSVQRRKRIEKLANSKYNEGSTEANVKRYLKDERQRKRIQSENVSKTIEAGKQAKHIVGSNNYTTGRSYLKISSEEAQELVNKYAGTGDIKWTNSGAWANKEIVTADKIIGVCVDPVTGEETKTRRFTIHYSKKGVHIVPAKEVDNA